MNLFDGSENALLTSGHALGKRALPSLGCKVEAPWLYGAFFRYRSVAEPNGVNGAAVKRLKRVLQTNSSLDGSSGSVAIKVILFKLFLEKWVSDLFSKTTQISICC